MLVRVSAENESAHRGVGVVVTNADRSRFFVQQKDADYPSFPLCYSFFGGSLEPGETVAQALRRELVEELGKHPANTILGHGASEVFDGPVSGPERSYRFTLFEAVVEDDVLDMLSQVEVAEGERGAVFERVAFRALPFIWSLEQVVDAYLGVHDEG
jgi:8-oxo-dGTP pyrophosphatase MutT (NUDIX family)